MTRRRKFLVPAIAVGFVYPAFTLNALATELNIYAGPQSVTPREVIYVTVQSEDSNAAIELSYRADGKVEILTGTAVHGMISFEVPSQKTTGQMGFTAKSETGLSNTSLVSVLAGPPKSFNLEIKRGKQVRTVDVWSDIISDQFGNSISDHALVSIDLIDDRGLIASQNVQLTQGRIVSNTKCPREINGDLFIRAVVNDAADVTTDMSSLCQKAMFASE